MLKVASATSSRLAQAWLLAALLSPSGSARADAPSTKHAVSRIVAVQESGVVRWDGTSWQFAKALPEGVAAIDVASLAAHGGLFVLHARTNWYAARADSPWRRLGCERDVTVDPAGRYVLCGDAGHVMRHDLWTSDPPTQTPAKGAAFVVGDGIIWMEAGGAVWKDDWAGGAKRQVATEAPLGDFTVNPQGTRALGRYAGTFFERRAEVAGEGLFTFALDGRGARRASMRFGVPRQWSSDGEWLLLQAGDQACIVRPIGGQYKCWTGAAMSIAPDGQACLLSREDGVYRAVLSGARAATPTRLSGPPTLVAAYEHPGARRAGLSPPGATDRYGHVMDQQSAPGATGAPGVDDLAGPQDEPDAEPEAD